MNYVISIVDAKSENKLSEIFAELKLPLILSMPGRGTAVESMLSILGIESDEKWVNMTVADADTTAKLIREMKRKVHIGVPGHGIVAAMPIKSVGGGKIVAFLNGTNKAVKYTPQQSYAYEMIIAITNEGTSDLVMSAARGAGARGGTVIHAKGSGEKDVEKFYNISIAAEKEIVLIVSLAEQKADIMKAILQKAGPDSEAGSVAFSLPVSDVAGFGMFDDEN